jgi:hypothetical protein
MHKADSVLRVVATFPGVVQTKPRILAHAFLFFLACFHTANQTHASPSATNTSRALIVGGIIRGFQVVIYVAVI